jgi:23S rRNA (guanosine2251-2'-O)-methyltransferase
MSGEMVYGRQPVLEVLRAGRREIRRVLMARNVRTAAAVIGQIMKQVERRSLTLESVSIPDLDRICHGGNHQGVAADVGAYPYVDVEDLAVTAAGATEPPLILLVDHVQDPQNLGSMLRTADAAGVTGVVIPRERATEVTAAVVRASAGAAEHVRVAQVTNLHQAMCRLKEQGIWMAGLEGTPEAALFSSVDLRGPVGIVVGSEGLGLGKLIADTCDVLMRIPMRGRVSSLNAAVAAALALYEVRRQRG